MLSAGTSRTIASWKCAVWYEYERLKKRWKQYRDRLRVCVAVCKCLLCVVHCRVFTVRVSGVCGTEAMGRPVSPRFLFPPVCMMIANPKSLSLLWVLCSVVIICSLLCSLHLDPWPFWKITGFMRLYLGLHHSLCDFDTASLECAARNVMSYLWVLLFLDIGCNLVV